MFAFLTQLIFPKKQPINEPKQYTFYDELYSWENKTALPQSILIIAAMQNSDNENFARAKFYIATRENFENEIVGRTSCPKTRCEKLKIIPFSSLTSQQQNVFLSSSKANTLKRSGSLSNIRYNGRHLEKVKAIPWISLHLANNNPNNNTEEKFHRAEQEIRAQIQGKTFKMMGCGQYYNNKSGHRQWIPRGAKKMFKRLDEDMKKSRYSQKDIDNTYLHLRTTLTSKLQSTWKRDIGTVKSYGQSLRTFSSIVTPNVIASNSRTLQSRDMTEFTPAPPLSGTPGPN